MFVSFGSGNTVINSCSEFPEHPLAELVIVMGTLTLKSNSCEKVAFMIPVPDALPVEVTPGGMGPTVQLNTAPLVLLSG